MTTTTKNLYLTDAQIEEFWREGFLLLKGILSPEGTATAKGAIWSLPKDSPRRKAGSNPITPIAVRAFIRRSCCPCYATINYMARRRIFCRARICARATVR